MNADSSVPFHFEPQYPEGIDPTTLTLGWKRVNPDLRSRDGFRYPWPGNWATVPDPDKCLPGPTCGHGLHIAKTWKGASSAGRIGTVIVVGYLRAEVAAEDAHKLRVPRLAVLDVVDAEAQVREGNLAGANLAGANLSGANLVGADLTRANLAWANLAGANLSGANLTGANLAGAYLAGANLAGADLAGAYRSASDPPIPRWRRDDLTGRLTREDSSR